MDHDQYFKVLLKAFFREFFSLFFPPWVDRIDFTRVEWLDKEVFVEPPQGERLFLDLVAKLHLLRPVPGQRAGESEARIALIHVEIESADKVAPLRSRMHAYYRQLRHDHGLPVLPIGLYLRVGLEGIGWDVYEEHFWEHRLLRFEYAYVGLPALDGEAFMGSPNLLGVALAAFMRIPEERKAELLAEALQRVAGSRENDYRRALVVDFLEAYWPLNEAQRQEFDALLDTERFKGVRPMQMTTYQKGMLKGMEEGVLKERREVLQIQLEARFGPLSPQLQQRLESLPAERLRELLLAVVKAQSLRELGLEG